jgi:branched-chain amino acid transport system permease protein
MVGGIYALVASGFGLVLGALKIFNFCQGQFYMLGAFVAYGVFMVLGLPYALALVLAFLFAAALGILLQIGIIKHVYAGFMHQVVATISFGVIIRQISILSFANEVKILTPLTKATFNLGGIFIPESKLLVIGIALLIMLGLYYWLRTKTGTAMKAVTQDMETASIQGINVNRIFWITMAIGCGLSGLGGAIIAPVLSANARMGDDMFLKVMMVVLIGGTGSMGGAVLASFLVGMVESFGYQFVGQFNTLIIWVLLAALIFFRPGGLLGKPLPVPAND